jgi:phosphoserine phosphatase RsbU/P
VGGDLYDFFLLDDDHLCLAIGDVSGKGVPASLFMAVTITLLRAVGHRVGAPDEVLARVNAPLCRDNDSAMFVTMFFGICNVHTGELTYVCGGHPAPHVVRADGRVEALPQARGFGLGVSERASYQVLTATLDPGDAVVLYTDGVTEAMDSDDGMFGTERLEEALAATGGRLDAGGLVAAVREAVRAFAAGTEQYDDITLLAFRRSPEDA